MFRLLLLSVLSVGVSFSAQARTALLPVDQGSQDASFETFRVQLTEILFQKNVPELLKRVHPKIEFSFGDEAGRKNFIKNWDLDANPADSALWVELEKVLGLGGKFNEKGEFVAPYVFAAWPEDKDAYGHAAVLGSGVRVRARGDLNADVVYNATHEILEVVNHNPGAGEWSEVLTPAGQTGFIRSEYIRSPIDYRAIFAKNRSGEWQMRVFIAGD